MPFEPAWAPEPGPTRVMYDEVEVEDVTDRMGADRTFFCIDVEDTHNFVTAGGVVHNCRPPGNRDPLPAGDRELPGLPVAAARADRAARGLHARQLRHEAAARRPGTGITRLHGREELRQIGPRVVRLYPLFHPAAALYTRSMLDVLRADFERIPGLLALPAPEQPEPEPVEPEPEPEPEPVAAVEEPEPQPSQLGLF